MLTKARTGWMLVFECCNEKWTFDQKTLPDKVNVGRCQSCNKPLMVIGDDNNIYAVQNRKPLMKGAYR